MKRGFVLPIVMILMTILMAMSLVLSRIAEDKTRSLKVQEGGYYSGKEITIEVQKNTEAEQVGKKPFQDVVNIYSGEGIEFMNGSHTKKSTNGRFARIKSNESNSCQLVGGVAGNDFTCVEDGDLLVSGYTLPSISFGSTVRVIEGTETLSPGERYKELTIKGAATFEEGVYYIKKLTIDKGSVVLEPGANVKIYCGEAVEIKGDVNAGGAPSQLLLINGGSSDTKLVESSVVKGFLYTKSKVVVDNTSKMYGALITGGLVQINSNSFIEYDEEGANKFEREHITDINRIDW